MRLEEGGGGGGDRRLLLLAGSMLGMLCFAVEVRAISSYGISRFSRRYLLCEEHFFFPFQRGGVFEYRVVLFCLVVAQVVVVGVVLCDTRERQNSGGAGGEGLHAITGWKKARILIPEALTRYTGRGRPEKRKHSIAANKQQNMTRKKKYQQPSGLQSAPAPSMGIDFDAPRVDCSRGLSAFSLFPSPSEWSHGERRTPSQTSRPQTNKPKWSYSPHSCD